jgi:phage recombination protein Bet
MNQEIKKKEEIVDQATLLQYLKTLNQHLSDVETNQFLQISIAYGLNPFKREIYASKYGGNFSIVVGYETYIKRAERSGLLDGWKVTTEGSFNPSNPRSSDLKAIITIYRSDFKHPFEHEVEFAEYCQFTKEGNVTKFWKEKPITMIKKVAISQGFRLCFSDELGGLPYTKEEIGQEEATFTTVSSEPLKPQSQAAKPEVLDPEAEMKKNQAVLENALKLVKLSNNKETLLKIWNDFSSLKTNETFKEAVAAKNRLFTEQEAEEASVEEQEAEEVKTEELPANELSNSFSAKEAISMIEKIEDLEKLEEFITFETRETVMNAKSKRSEYLTKVNLQENE